MFVIPIIVGLIIGIMLSIGDLWTTQSIAKVVDNYRQILQQSPGSESKLITLYESWDISQAYAQSWSKDAVLISLTSADVDDPDTGKPNEDGQRRTWQAVFTSSNLNKQLFFQVTDGVVVDALEDGAHDPGIPTITEKPIMDSPEALKRTKETVSNFGPSVGRGKGYHFILQTDVEGKVVLTVVGSASSSDEKQLPTSINFDVKTGQITEVQQLP